MARRGSAVTEEGPVEITRGETIHRGSYRVAGGMVTVSDETGSKTTHVGATPAASMARILLGELVREEATRQAKQG